MKVDWNKKEGHEVTFDNEYDTVLNVMDNNPYYVTPLYFDKGRYNINFLYYDDSPGPLLTNSIEFQFIIYTNIKYIDLSKIILVIHSVEESAFFDIHDVPDHVLERVRTKIRSILPEIETSKLDKNIEQLRIMLQVLI